MQHPFSGILNEEGVAEPGREETDGQSRRECLKSVLQVGAGVVAAGIVGTADGAVTRAGPGHPEHGGRPLGVTKAATSHPEHGGRPPAVTRAGPGHPEHGGKYRHLKHPTGAGKSLEDGNGQTKLANVDKELDAIAALAKKGQWAEAANRLSPLRGLKAGPSGSKAAGQHKRREALEKQLAKQVKTALTEADKQAKSGELVPALETYRKAQRLNEIYGAKQRTGKAIAALAKQPGYAEALEKVKAIEAAKKTQPPKVTTMALGEEGSRPPGRITTKAIGEEGGRPPGRITTHAVGEEGGRPPHTTQLGKESGERPPGPQPIPTTLAVGEEG